MLMEAGNRVPADGRLIVAATLEIEEAALTGESTPTLKSTVAIDKEEVGIGDRLCMAFMNTSVTRGRGEMIVTGTGMDTEIGHIADLLSKTKGGKTPLQKQLDRLTIVIAGIAGLAFILMVISLFSIAIGLSARDETHTVLNRDILADRRQVEIYGLALILIFLATELGFMQRILETTSLGGNQWLICIIFACGLLVIDEGIKLFMRRQLQSSLMAR